MLILKPKSLSVGALISFLSKFLGEGSLSVSYTDKKDNFSERNKQKELMGGWKESWVSHVALW